MPTVAVINTILIYVVNGAATCSWSWRLAAQDQPAFRERTLKLEWATSRPAARELWSAAAQPVKIPRSRANTHYLLQRRTHHTSSTRDVMEPLPVELYADDCVAIPPESPGAPSETTVYESNTSGCDEQITRCVHLTVGHSVSLPEHFYGVGKNDALHLSLAHTR
jgi:hypothetical protein